MKLSCLAAAAAAILSAGSLSVSAAMPSWVLADAQKELSAMTTLRHKLHAAPELGNQEYNTQKEIVRLLTSYGVDKIITGWKDAPTAVIGILNPEKGDAIGLRSDIDALNVKENTGLPYASTAKGMMWGEETYVSHMCGHDAHMTMLLTAAKILAAHKKEVNRKVVFVFQPAEEGDSLHNRLKEAKVPLTGADALVKNGLLKDLGIRHMFGMHVAGNLPSGRIFVRTGSAMNSADVFEINITGKQSHGAAPWEGVDAAYVTAETLVALQQIIARNQNIAAGTGSLTVGKMTSGEAANVMPGKGFLLGTIRANTKEIRDTFMKRIPEVAQHTALAAGAKADARIIEMYPVTWNDPKTTATYLAAMKEAGLPAESTDFNPGGSEDFSFYAQAVPSSFLMLGVAKPGTKGTINHSDRFVIDDAAMVSGAAAHVTAALTAFD